MSTKITHKVKNQVWEDYTKNSNSKKELKQMFLGMNPTSAYKKISLKLKKKLDEAKVSSSPLRKTLRPKIKIPKKLSKGTLSPSRKTIKSERTTSHHDPKRRISSPKRISPQRSSQRSSKRSPKRSPQRSSKRSPINPSNTKLFRSPSRKSKKDKLSSVRLIKS